MEEYLRNDMGRFAQAVKETGAALSVTEPVFALATQFEEEMNVALAAAEAGLEIKDFQELLARTPKLSQATGLLLVGGTLKRDVFVDAFPLIAEARRLRVLKPVVSSTARERAALPTSHSSGARVASTAAGERPGYPAERLNRVPDSFFGHNGPRFDDVGPNGSLLVGVRISTHPFLGRPKVSSVQPLYRASPSSRTLVEGEHHGEVTGPETTAVAKSRYAVGAIKTRTGLSLDGFVIIFMKVKGDRLDPSDSYESPVLGDSEGGSPATVSGNGNAVIGFQGLASKNVNALGLILAK
jgi:hypothetical protein